MARLAIIVPYLGQAKLLEDTLVSVLSNRPRDAQVLVVLARFYDDPYDLEGEVQFVRTSGRAGWVASLNAGIEASRAQVVHWLACGAEVSEGWADAAIGHFDNPRVAAVAPLVVDQGQPDRVIAAGMSYHVGGLVRPLAAGKSLGDLPVQPRGVLAPHPATAFYRRSVFDQAGLLDRRAGDRWAGVDLGLVLHHLGLRSVLEPRCRVAVRPEASFRRGAFGDAMESERFFWRWATATGLWRSLLLHGVLLTGEALRGLTDLSILSRWAGRLLGSCLALGRAGQRRRILSLQEEARTRQIDSPVNAPHFPLPAGRSASRLRLAPPGSARPPSPSASSRP